MPWARASALDRHLECPAASHLPRLDRGRWAPGYLQDASEFIRRPPQPAPDDDRVLAEWGIQMHLAKEGAAGATDPWLSWMEPHRSRLWPADLGRHEVPFALDCRTGAVAVGRPGPRDRVEAWKAATGPNTVVGTTDWWGQLPGGEPWVDDLKTGWQVPPVSTPQMLCYGLVSARVAGANTSRASITHWRRGWDSPNRYWLTLTDSVLTNFWEQLRAAWKRAVSGGDDPRPGPWCRYCPSVVVCPAHATR